MGDFWVKGGRISEGFEIEAPIITFFLRVEFMGQGSRGGPKVVNNHSTQSYTPILLQWHSVTVTAQRPHILHLVCSPGPFSLHSYPLPFHKTAFFSSYSCHYLSVAFFFFLYFQWVNLSSLFLNLYLRYLPSLPTDYLYLHDKAHGMEVGVEIEVMNICRLIFFASFQLSVK